MSSYGWASTEICAVRVLSLKCDGTIQTGSDNGYVTCGVVSFSMKKNMERGEEKRYKSASNCVCGYKRNKDMLVGLDLELKLCPQLDPELNYMLSRDGMVQSSGHTIGGYAEPIDGTCSCDDCTNCVTDDVSFEWWTRAWDNRHQATQNGACMFWHWVVPRSTWTSGDFTFDNEIMRQTFTGYSTENAAWGTGPAANPFSTAVLRPYHYELTATAPPACAVGFQTVALTGGGGS